MRLMGTEINLVLAWQIIIIDLKYILYAKEQVEGKITRIGQINCLMAHFLICYDIEIEKKIKHHNCKQAKMIKKTVQTEVKKDRVT